MEQKKFDDIIREAWKSYFDPMVETVVEVDRYNAIHQRVGVLRKLLNYQLNTTDLSSIYKVYAYYAPHLVPTHQEMRYQVILKVLDVVTHETHVIILSESCSWDDRCGMDQARFCNLRYNIEQ